jgi:hypothetical protein
MNPSTAFGKGWLVPAALLLIMGFGVLWEARTAQLQHTVIQSMSPKTPWMSPLQGFVAGFLCVGFGAYFVARAFSKPSGR